MGHGLLHHPIHRVETVVSDGLAIWTAHNLFASSCVVAEGSSIQECILDRARPVPFIIRSDGALAVVELARLFIGRDHRNLITSVIVRVARGRGISTPVRHGRGKLPEIVVVGILGALGARKRHPRGL